MEGKVIKNNLIQKVDNRMEETGDAPMGISRMALTKPLICAISGFAVAGGLELSLLGDIRICETNAIFGVFCRRFGVPLIGIYHYIYYFLILC